MLHPTLRATIELKPSKIDHMGIGVFALVDIKPRDFVATGLSESDFEKLMLWSEYSNLEQHVKRKVDAFCIGTPDGFVPPDDFDFDKLSVEWYFNHSCAGNLGFNETGDFIATRSIGKGDELAYDYGLAESNPIFRMSCSCGSSICRGLITGDDWKDTQFREKNLSYMHPRLKRMITLDR